MTAPVSATKDPTTRSARTIVLLVLAAVVVLGGLTAAAIFATSAILGEGGASAVERPTVDQLPAGTRIAIELTGDELSADDLATTADVLAGRLERAGVVVAGVAIDGEGLVIGFDGEADDATVAAASTIIAAPLTMEFRGVRGVSECTTDDPVLAEPDGETLIACDRDRAVSYVLGMVELDGTAIGRVEAGEDDRADTTADDAAYIDLELDADGTRAFATLTAHLFALPTPENQIALVVGGEVLTAPAVAGAIENGQVRIAGLKLSDARKLADEIRLAGRDVQLGVRGITTAP